MTHAGGKTTRRTTRTGDVRYEIAVASSMLFDAFADADRGVSVAGLECGNRLDALQRVMEHEMVHLIEQLCWKSSDCSASRFQDMAARIFRHRAHTHNLVTRRERASAAGIMVGSRVTFTFEDRRLTGRVNRSHQARYCTCGRPKRREIFKWLAVQDLLRADPVVEARDSD